MSVTATIVCDFGGNVSDSMLTAELDGIKNNDKISFLTTETAFFTIYKYPNSLIVHKPVPTSGMVVEIGSVTRTKTETLEFVGTKTLSLSYPPNGPVTVNRWYGNVGQNFTISKFNAIILSEAPCICEVTYKTIGTSWELIPPNNIDLTVTPEWPICIYITADDLEEIL